MKKQKNVLMFISNCLESTCFFLYEIIVSADDFLFLASALLCIGVAKKKKKNETKYNEIKNGKSKAASMANFRALTALIHRVRTLSACLVIDTAIITRIARTAKMNENAVRIGIRTIQLLRRSY